MSSGPIFRSVVFLITFVPVQGTLQAQQPVRIPKSQLQRLRASSATLVRQTGEPRLDTIPRTDTTIVLRPREFVIAAPLRGTSFSVRDSAQSTGPQLNLPIEFLAATRRGVRQLRVVIDPGEGLSYNSIRATFTSSVHIGLEDQDRPDERVDLQWPFPLQVIAMGGTTTPEVLQLDHTEVPLESVLIEHPAPGDTLRFRVHYSQQSPVEVALPVQRVALAISPSHVRISGLGLEQATFSVRLPSQLSVDSFLVTFSVSEGPTPDPPDAYATGTRPARTTLRSKGGGQVTLRAEGPHFTRAATATIEYVFPWLFLGTAVAGGFLGVVIRESTRKGKRTRGSFVRQGLAGVLVGLLVAVAYAIGVNLLPFQINGPPVEATVFFVSGVGAILGVELLRKQIPAIDKLLGGTAKSAPT
jgi:hypothetical protein